MKSIAEPIASARVRREEGRGLRRPALVFLAIAVALYVVAAVAHSALPEAKDAGGQSDLGAPSVLQGWVRFDSGWYASIADNGYSYTKGQQSSIAFFPGYPLALRGVTAVVDSDPIGGTLLTLVSGLAVALLWWTWLRDRLEGRARMLAFSLLLLFPYAWFLYGTLYADALFLAFVLGAFVLADRRHWVLAGLVGALATATRPVAPAVIIGLIAVALDTSGALTRVASRTDPARRRWHLDRGRLHPALAGVLLSGAGLAAWCAYLWSRFGDPVAFLTVQSAPGWAQGAGPHTWFKLGFFDLLFGGHLFALRLIPQGLATLAFLALAPAVWKRFGWGYGVYTLAVVGIPALGTGDFQGMGRYLLAAFPVFALVGAWLTERAPGWLRAAAVPASAVCLLLGTAMFASGFYLT
ncbi:MAG: hypothetical protein QOE63_1868 [Acidimicrobiaceae bacterium]